MNTKNKMTIYDPIFATELRDYTLKMLMLLKRRGFVAQDNIEHVLETLLDDKDTNTSNRRRIKNSQKRELEYIQIDGRDYYYCDEDSTIYTYDNKPKYIGQFDHLTQSILSI